MLMNRDESARSARHGGFFFVSLHGLFRVQDSFMRELGHSLYRELQGRGLLLKESGGSSSVAASLPRLNELLSLFTSCNFCTGYRSLFG